MYLKCRIPRCKLAYVTHHSVRSLNAHHRTYHSGVTYTCAMCSKLLTTPTTMKWHMHSHSSQVYKCNKCDKKFVYRSKLRQHCHSHLKQRLYQCYHRKCQQKYCHPQDLARHTLTHTMKTFECDLCEKTFKQKRLLRRHEAIHNATYDTPVNHVVRVSYTTINFLGITNYAIKFISKSNRLIGTTKHD